MYTFCVTGVPSRGRVFFRYQFVPLVLYVFSPGTFQNLFILHNWPIRTTQLIPTAPYALSQVNCTKRQWHGHWYLYLSFFISAGTNISITECTAYCLLSECTHPAIRFLYKRHYNGRFQTSPHYYSVWSLSIFILLFRKDHSSLLPVSGVFGLEPK